MKRTHSECDEEDETTKRKKECDMEVLQEMQEKLTQKNNEVNAEMECAKQKYYISYFKKVIEKLPISKDIIDVSTISESIQGFSKVYSICQTCVNAEIQLKKLMALNSIYDMIFNLSSKVIHDKAIIPYLSSLIPKEVLMNAFSVFQTDLNEKEDDDTNKLHCVSYLIQDEIEKKETLKIPNPIYNRFTKQITALEKIGKGMCDRECLPNCKFFVQSCGGVCPVCRKYCRNQNNSKWWCIQNIKVYSTDELKNADYTFVEKMFQNSNVAIVRLSITNTYNFGNLAKIGGIIKYIIFVPESLLRPEEKVSNEILTLASTHFVPQNLPENNIILPENNIDKDNDIMALPYGYENKMVNNEEFDVKVQ
ncbi:uncharacterized protein CDAR_66721 [Caerostris darwini]|uniref:Uncharacterized protein n=1 Tax=Caerostris darwini TaxID=1538125 RepID=A0AAV4T9D1_9ARAC|nr:uncharacterized protein CDAR_66721 [Caerostris darwini]